MAIIPRFSATHNHGGHHPGAVHRHRAPLIMYSSPRNGELHQHNHRMGGHHQAHPTHSHHHQSNGYLHNHPHSHPHSHHLHSNPLPIHHFHHTQHHFPPTHHHHTTTGNHHHQHHHHQQQQPPSSSSIASPINTTSSIHSQPPPPLQQVVSPNSNTKSPILSKPPLTEKTPMCLINELVRHNKIKCIYRLSDESGPSHLKNFTVILKLGNEESEVYEEYIASGPSIKKAQHAAAALALEETKLKHPSPKVKPPTNGVFLPTVELNTLAMKRRETIQYELIHPYHDPKCQRKDMRRNSKKAMMKNTGESTRHPKEVVSYDNNKKYIVNLKVGERFFKGEGTTLKGAKHDAAYAALQFLKNAPANKFELDPSTAPFVPGNPLSSKPSVSNEHKSPVSLVHENALKRNLSVTFRVESESGPPHMKTFITKCTLGEFSTEGHGEAKKISKKRSATLMLEKLKTLPPLANCSVSKRSSGSSNKAHKRKTISSAKRRAKSLVKLQTSESENESFAHPISRLIQIQQAKKEKEPIYSLVEEKGMKRKLEFVMQVKVGDLTATGSGPNKKSAKRVAAENMMGLMGISVPGNSSSKESNPELNNNNSQETNGRDETTKDKDSTKSSSTSKNSVPGIIFLEQTAKTTDRENEDYGVCSKGGHPTKQTPITTSSSSNSKKNKKTKSTDLKAKNSSEMTINDSTNNPTCNSDPLENSGEAKIKLAKLSEIFKFSVSYTDFQKKGKNSSSSSSEYLTLVSLSMKPTQVSHGSGSTPQESQENAAKSALNFLSDNGLYVPSSSPVEVTNESV